MQINGIQRAFVIDDDVFTAFDAPGSSATIAWDMNPAGTIVGLFVAAGSTHGFVLDHWRVVGREVTGDYATINFPLTSSTNAAYTDVFGINASGDIVGKYRETVTGPFHGYIATRKGDLFKATYPLEALCPLTAHVPCATLRPPRPRPRAV